MEDVNLEVGEIYLLQYSGAFCHRYTSQGRLDFSEDMNSGDRVEAIFVGTVCLDRITNMTRNVFYSSREGYYMFDSKKNDYIVKRIQI